MKIISAGVLATVTVISLSACQSETATVPESANSTEQTAPTATIASDATPTDGKSNQLSTSTVTGVQAQQTTAAVTQNTGMNAAAQVPLPTLPGDAIAETDRMVSQLIDATTIPLTDANASVIKAHLENVIATTSKAPGVDPKTKNYMEQVTRDAIISLGLAKGSADVKARSVQLNQIRRALDQVKQTLSGDREKD